jgi:hypothetical protein
MDTSVSNSTELSEPPCEVVPKPMTVTRVLEPGLLVAGIAYLLAGTVVTSLDKMMTAMSFCNVPVL